jgi:alkylation response protein AidB-like acyl-CoA dehydrogenase
MPESVDPQHLTDFRAEVRAWLESVAAPRTAEPRIWGQGEEDLAIFRSMSHDEERAYLDRVRAYRQARYDAGFGALTLPTEVGGRGLPSVYSVAFSEEERAFVVPPSSEIISVTTGLVGAAVSVFGTTEQRDRFATAFLRTDLLCCQLFSEPGAGSDLAGLTTKAERSGDDWLITGQKIWSSAAQFADYGFLLARTDPKVVKQAGITAFLVPMDAPGVEIRPIRQMSGPSSFNEVYFDSVRVGDDLRIGPIDGGWKIAQATLGFERSSSGSGHRRKGGTIDDLVDLARATGRVDDPVIRQSIADVLVRTTLQAATSERVARAAAVGSHPGAAGSLTKLIASDNLVRIGDVAGEILGVHLLADTGEWGTFAWNEHILGAPGYRLAGGTDEVQRTIVAERVLGLPPEERRDRGPFEELSRT